MASVQELLLAANAQKSPLISGLEGLAQGFHTAQSGALERAKTLIAIENERQDRARQDEMDKALMAQLAGQQENRALSGLHGVGGMASPLPQAKFTQAIGTGEKGRMKATWTQVDSTGGAAGMGGAKPLYTPQQVEAIASKDPMKLSAAFPSGVPSDAMTLSAAQTRISNTEAERANRDAERTQARFRNYFLDMEQRDPVIKALRTQDVSMGQVENLTNLVKEGNTVASAALGIKMAKGMGEVGVMTESDVTRYVQSKRIDRKVGDILSSWLRGRPTDATLDEVQQIAGVLQDTFRGKIQPRYDQYIRSYANQEKMKPETLAAELNLTYGGGKVAEPKPVAPPADVSLKQTAKDVSASVRQKLGLGPKTAK